MVALARYPAHKRKMRSLFRMRPATDPEEVRADDRNETSFWRDHMVRGWCAEPCRAPTVHTVTRIHIYLRFGPWAEGCFPLWVIHRRPPLTNIHDSAGGAPAAPQNKARLHGFTVRCATADDISCHGSHEILNDGNMYAGYQRRPHYSHSCKRRHSTMAKHG